MRKTDRPENQACLPAWGLELLRCPHDGSPLCLAAPALVALLRNLQLKEQLVNWVGLEDRQALQGGLVNSSTTIFYAICEDIPNLLPDDAIPLSPSLGRLAITQVRLQEPQ